MPEAAGGGKLPKATHYFILLELIESIEMHILISLNILFLRNKLGFSTIQVISLTHSADMINLFLAPIGALIIDSGGNKYVIMIIYYIRSMIIQGFVVSSSIPELRYIAEYLVYARYSVGLILNIIVCSVVAPFHGDQFNLPDQKDAFKKFFRILYIMDKIGIIVGFIVGPAIKTYIGCLGEQDCYFFSFSISLVLAVLTLIIFLIGTKTYNNIKPERNIALDIIKCSGYGFGHWVKERKTNPKDHWLDHAEPKYGAELVKDIKQLGKMVLIFTAVPLYESLYCQLDSEWLFQATRLDGRIGSFTIIPEYFQLIHPILGIIMIPFLTHYFDAFLEKIKMDRTFRKMIFGGLMTVLAFVAAGFLETTIKQSATPHPKKGEAQVRMYNNFNCTCIVTASSPLPQFIQINSHGAFENLHVPIKGNTKVPISLSGECITNTEHEISLEPKSATSVFITNVDGAPTVNSHTAKIDSHADTGLPELTVIGAKKEDSLIIRDSKDVEIYLNVEPTMVAGQAVVTESNRIVEVEPESYVLELNGRDIYNFAMHSGGKYAIIISEDSVDFFTVTEPNSVHMLWMIPQSVLLVFGEVYFGITLHEFTYSEAPKSLKTFINALLHFAMGVGHLFLVTVVNFLHMDLDYEFYFFAAVLLLNMCYFTILAFFYKSLQTDEKLI